MRGLPKVETRALGPLKPAARDTQHDHGIEIDLHHHFSAKVYTSGSSVTGDLVVSPRRDVPFTGVRVALAGDMSVIHDDMYGAQQITHKFLAIDVPVAPNFLPEDAVFEAGKPFRIPFEVVIPHQLPEAVASYTPSVDIDNQFSLPPALGNWERNDMSPETVQINYEIRASILQEKTSRSHRLDARKRILVIPASRDQLPWTDVARRNDSVVSKSGGVRKSLFSQPIGKLHVAASFASPAHLHLDSHEESQTTVLLSLAFNPKRRDTSPPEISQVLPKILSHTTWYGRSGANAPSFANNSRCYSSSASPASSALDIGTWERHTDVSAKHAGENQKDRLPFYTTAMKLTLDLPTSDHTFLPTFQSRFISRSYSVQLKFVAGVESFKLVVPLEVLVHSNSKQGPACNRSFDVLPTFQEAVKFS